VVTVASLAFISFTMFTSNSALVNRTNVPLGAAPRPKKLQISAPPARKTIKRPCNEPAGRLKKRVKLVSEDEDSTESSSGWESGSDVEMEDDSMTTVRQRRTAFHMMDVSARGKPGELRVSREFIFRSVLARIDTSGSLPASGDPTNIAIVCFFT